MADRPIPSRAERLEAAARDLLNAVTFDDSGAGGRGGNGGLISRETIAKADRLRLILSEPAEPVIVIPWDEPVAWTERVANLREALGREPTLYELVGLARQHEMTPAEIEAQRQSFHRGMAPTGDPRFD